jgi:hypothetical protein
MMLGKVGVAGAHRGGVMVVERRFGLAQRLSFVVTALRCSPATSFEPYSSEQSRRRLGVT